MYSNSLVRTETDGIYISIHVEIATEGICRGAETTQNLPVQVNAVWQQMVLLRTWASEGAYGIWIANSLERHCYRTWLSSELLQSIPP